MTEERQDITSDFYAGNHMTLRVTTLDSDGMPKNLTGGELTYSLFNDAGATFIIKSSLDIYQINMTNPSTGIFEIYLKPSDSALLNGLYRHQCNLVDVNGLEKTLFTGKVQIFKSYAKRVRSNNKHAYLVGG